MKSKLVDTVTSDNEFVRLRIFDGEFPPDKAYEELLRIERERSLSAERWHNEKCKRYELEIARLRQLVKHLKGDAP